MKAEFAPTRDVAIERSGWGERRYNGNAFDTQMDPQAQDMRYPTKAPRLWNRRNQVFDVVYEGGDNIADNTTAVARLNRGSSQYALHDVGVLPLQIFYLGLGLDPASKNLAYNQQFVNTETEALSSAYATQLTDLAFLKQVIETDIPQMLSGDAGKAGYMVWYQQIVQSFMAIFAKYNSTLSLNDALIAMGYNGEAPQITELMNLLKKQNIYSLLQQIGIVVSQEYADLDWFKETTVLNGLQSRLADDVQSPLLTIVGVPYVPHVRVRLAAGQTPVFSTFPSDSSTIPGVTEFNTISVTANGSTKTYTLNDLVFHIMMKLDPFQILSFSRQRFNGQTVQTAENYVNDLIACMHALLNVASAFKAYTVDFDTYLMVLQNSTQLNHWVINAPFTAPSRPREQIQPVCIRVIDDIFKAYGTSGNLVYDNNTRRWSIFTPWRGDSGIVEYDAKDGGFALSTSVRAVPTDPNGYLDIKYLFPRMFSRYVGKDDNGNTITYYQWFCARDGSSFMMETAVLTGAQIINDPYLSYLNANRDTNLSIEIPKINLSSVTVSALRASSINKVMVSLFGMSQAVFQNISNEAVNTDVLMYVGRQFGNFAEDSMNYLQARAPMRLTDAQVSLGFKFDARV